VQADIVPTSYSYSTPPSTGSGYYEDDTGTQLTDGLTSPFWNTSVNGAMAYEWVAFNSKEVDIDFSFGEETYIESVLLGMAVDNTVSINEADVDLFYKVDADWELADSYLAETYLGGNYKVNIAFDVNVSATEFRLSLKRNATKWVFIDEVSFAEGNSEIASATDVPIQLSGAIGLILLALGFKSKRKS
jgi:hypothetical protein